MNEIDIKRLEKVELTKFERKVIIQDNLNAIIESINNPKYKVYDILLLNPHPSQDFRLKYKEGETNYQHIGFWKALWKSKFIYPWDVYEYTYENGNTQLFNIEEIKNYIKYKSEHYFWMKYVYKEKEKMPIWENYAIRVYYKDEYGNPLHCSTIYNLITEDKEEAEKMYNTLKEKYLTDK